MAVPNKQSSAPPRQLAMPAPRRMLLSTVQRGRSQAPDRILLAGTEGIGKTTWAAGAPAPVFLPVEDGVGALDVARFPAPETWPDVLDAIRTLTEDAHDFKTLVVDTLDALEPKLWDHIAKRDQKANVEDYGYGKGYIAAVDEWRVFLGALERLRHQRGMEIILIAHVWVKPFKNPEGDDYDRYELKLHHKAAGLLKEWVDAVLFARWETFTDKLKNGSVKGVSTGARLIHTRRTAAWDAKNRYSLPETLPLNYDDYAAARVARQPADPAALKEAIAAKLAELADEAVNAKVQPLLEAAGDNAEQLANIDNRLSATLRQRKGA